MIDIVSVVIGIGLTVVGIFVVLVMQQIRTEAFDQVLDDPTDDPDIKRVYDTPHCPDCGSYDLRLDSATDGVPWLDTHTTEIDYYQCLRCARRFSDEEWKDAKSYRSV